MAGRPRERVGSGEDPVETDSRLALAPRPVVWGWLVAVGVDLLLNAGLFTRLFDQAREPALLPDGALFARIPIAYGVVVVATIALAWLLDRTDVAGGLPGARTGAVLGVLLALTGPVWLVTAVDLSWLFVTAAMVVLVAQTAAAGAVLGSVRGGLAMRVVGRRATVAFVVCAGLGVVAQNVLAAPSPSG